MVNDSFSNSPCPLRLKQPLTDLARSTSATPGRRPCPSTNTGLTVPSAVTKNGKRNSIRKSRSNVDLVLMKNSKYAFDLEIMTQTQKNGRLKFFLGIDKVRKSKGGSISDIVNGSSPNKVSVKTMPRDMSM